MHAVAPVTIDIQTLIDQRPLGRFQKMVILAGFCLIALDGYDLTCMGFIAPALKAQWQLSNLALGPVLSAGLIGLGIGAMAAGPIADRIGRKKVLLACLLVLGGFTLAATVAQNLSQLTILRFAAGLGMGALLPNAATLVSEFVPRNRRSLAMSLAYCGLPMASAGGGFLAARLIPDHGWQSVLLIGGALPLLALPLYAWKLPESPTFLAARGIQGARIRAILQRLAPEEENAQAILAAPLQQENSGAMQLVLSRPYLAGSVLLWVAYFATLFMLHLLLNWLPTLIRQDGFDLDDAAIVAGMFQFGGVIGTLTLGWYMDRLGLHKTLAASYSACALVLAALSNAAHVLGMLAALAFLLGLCLVGAAASINSLAASYYPTRARATGTSWMHAAGRLGAILSAFAGAQMLSQGWNAAAVFMALTVPAACAGLSILGQKRAGN